MIIECAKCHRAVSTVDVDVNDLCVFCQPPSDLHLPPADEAHPPTEEEWQDLGRPVQEVK